LNFLAVFFGGGLGAMCRYGLARLVSTSASGFPTATFMANILSCIILGYLISLATEAQIDNKLQLFLMTGFCGGFSTFSTFSSETLSLFQNDQPAIALLYIGASVLVCLIAIYLGIKIGSLL